MSFILHITERSRWQIAEQTGQYRADSLDSEGFIHCSTTAQVIWVANQFYRGLAGLVLLKVDPEKLTSELRYDLIETGDRFPHVYGPINIDAVIQVIDFAPEADDTFQLPVELQIH